MNIVLKPYQNTAVGRCAVHIRRSIEDWDSSGTTSAVALSAFTSAGKTIIATALIERLRFGDGASTGENPDFTVLWVTNSPALNRQTMDKMRSTSSRMNDDVLHDLNVDGQGVPVQSSLTPGKIYFLNTQMLSKGASSYQASESRPVGLEQMIRNTVDHLGTNFVMMIDEAHIGTTKGEGGRAPIAYRLMNGDSDGFGKFPVVLGISATPARFLQGIDNTGREPKVHEVPVAEIRKSGLIKKRLLAHVPTEGEYLESKLLAAAVGKWGESDAAWAALHASNPREYARVNPLLLVQVEPGVSDERLGELLDDLARLDPRLEGVAVRHAFGNKDTIKVAGHVVEYIAPETIQATTQVRVVLFKDALTTGWDCPRAEVMISLRTARDITYVKQMIGRMVRTPLADEIPNNEFLNDVTMYLPHYDMDTIAQVKADLNGDGDDPEKSATDVIKQPVDIFMQPRFSGGMDLETGETHSPHLYERLCQIKTHPRPRRRRGPVPRLKELARMLETHGVVRRAESAATAHLASAMEQAYLEDKDAIDALALDRAAAKVSVVDMGDGLGGVRDVEASSVIDGYSLEGLPTGPAAARRFEEAKRICGADDALEVLWQRLAGTDPTADRFDDPDAHVESQLIATEVALIDGMRALVNAAAEAKFDAWTKAYGSTLRVAAQQSYVDVMAAAGKTVPIEVSFPVKRTIDEGEFTAPGDHLYLREDGNYPLDKALNGWESETLAALEAKPGFLGWWRNGTGGEYSLGVRYTSTAGEERTMYPDFLGIFDSGEREQFILFDPHGDIFDGQSRTKWLALADYLRDEANLDGDGKRIIDSAWAIQRVKNGEPLMAIDLSDDDVRAALAEPGTDVVDLFTSTTAFNI